MLLLGKYGLHPEKDLIFGWRIGKNLPAVNVVEMEKCKIYEVN